MRSGPRSKLVFVASTGKRLSIAVLNIELSLGGDNKPEAENAKPRFFKVLIAFLKTFKIEKKMRTYLLC